MSLSQNVSFGDRYDLAWGRGISSALFTAPAYFPAPRWRSIRLREQTLGIAVAQVGEELADPAQDPVRDLGGHGKLPGKICRSHTVRHGACQCVAFFYVLI